MRNIIKKAMEWATSKKSLYFSLAFVTAYTAVNLTLNLRGISVDDTLTEKVFDLFKTVIIASGALSGAKIVTGEKKGAE